jgi:hypothetical protein
MALKSVFSSMKREGYVIKPLDYYLLTLNKEDNDRAINVNAPSQIGSCLRSRYYARIGAEADPNTVDGRQRRIFDNGTGVHERLQAYLKKQGMLLADEIPVINTEYSIQGHTDGLLKLSSAEIGVLEIKSINSKGFSSLKGAKENHKLQGISYIYCLEERRKALHEKYKNMQAFLLDKKARYKYYEQFYQHLKGGTKHSRDEKIKFQCDLHNQSDKILMQTNIPITKAVFLYENKDTQELKEYLITTKSEEGASYLDSILNECALLNNYVDKKKAPPREGTNRSCTQCRWCNYKIECWN